MKNNMPIKMIVTDLDGTLLREDKTISERTKAILAQCRLKGHKVVYATGRGSSSKILAPSEMFDGFIRMNGATAYIGDTHIHNRLIPIDKVRGLLIAADAANIKIAAESGEVHYANFNVGELWPWLQRHYEPADFTRLDIEIEKIYAIAETPKVTELINKHLSDELYLCISRDNLAMVMHSDAVKSKAAAALAEHWNIKRHEIAAFGDDSNDIDLLKYCGVGVAMGNALDEVKAAAAHICDTNDNDGVAKWLEENVL